MFREEYARHLNAFNDYLTKVMNGLDNGAPEEIKDAMRYAILGGGKRIRPVLLLATAEFLGVEYARALPFALSIECIHTYSLVHDDLPAMDNDDYRRGRLSTHKKFGEATGILCGDALLNFAYEHALKNAKDINDVNALSILSEYAGYSGMIKGQVLDLFYEGKTADFKVLFEIYLNKTAKLLTAPLLMASMLSGGKYYDNLKGFGENLGVSFQIKDDILDVSGSLSTIGKTPNKDELKDKLTAVKIFGLDGAKIKAKEYYEKAISYIRNIKDADFLLWFAENIYKREN